MDATTLRLSNFLNQYLAFHVWNSPLAEYRRNIVPRLVSSTPKRGAYSIKNETIALPTKDSSYFLYILHQATFGGPRLVSDTWVSLTKVMDEESIQFRIHGDNGEMLYSDKIYAVPSTDGRLVYLAVEATMLRKILGSTYNAANIFVAPYYDSDKANPVIHTCYPTATNTNRNVIFAAVTDTSLVYVNGRAARLTAASDIHAGDYVEIYNDQNIVCRFDVDLTTADGNRSFNSVKDECQKYIIHIPKELNSENHLITHNTCDIYVAPKAGTYKHMNYMFLHRAQSGVDINQITHNDFAIPKYIIDDYRAFLDTDEVVLHVVCRIHSKERYLVPNRDYLQVLYTHDDDTILDFMEGIHVKSQNLPFWKAANLEQSKYVEMMNGIPAFVYESNIDDYIDALGYYNTISLLSTRIFRYVIHENMPHTVSVPMPTVFTSSNIHAEVYIAGLRIPSTEITETVYSSTVAVTIAETIDMPVDGELIIELFESGEPFNIKCEPAGEDSVMYELPDPVNFVLYEKVALSGVTLKGVGEELTYAYIRREVDDVAAIAEDEGVYYITFADTTYGKTFIIQSTNSLYTIEKDMDETIFAKEQLVIDLHTLIDETEDEFAPMFTPDTFQVFLNGKTLLRDIDYVIAEVTTSDNNIGARQLVIQNVGYLEDSNNHVGVVVSNDTMSENSTGFINNTFSVPNGMALLWQPGSSNLIIDGLNIMSAELTAGRLTTDYDGYRAGAPFGITTVFTKAAVDFVSTYHANDEDATIAAIRAYFAELEEEAAEELVILPYSHRIYSVFLHEIVKDVAAGDKVITVQPDASLALQQVAEYNYLQAFDVIFTTEQDLSFIDNYHSYAEFEVLDINLYNALEQIQAAALPADTITDGESEL